MAVFADSFTGTPGAPLSTRSGWTASRPHRPDYYKIGASGGLDLSAGGDGTASLHDIGEARHRIKVVLGAGFLSSPYHAFIIFGSGSSSLNLRLDASSSVLALDFGGSRLDAVGNPWAAGDVLEAEYDKSAKTAKVYKNGAQVHSQDLSAFNLDSTGSKVGFGVSYSGGPDVTDVFRSFEVETLAPEDTESPVLPGDIIIDARTTTTITSSCPTAADNVGVVKYNVRLSGGAWLDKGLVQSHTHTALTPGVSYTVEWSALDAMNNRSNILSANIKTFGSGATANTIRLTTGPQDGNPKGFLYDLAGTVAAGDWLNYEIISGPTPSGGTFSASPMGAFSYVGPSPAVLVIQPYVNGVATAEPITVNLYDQVGGGDTESPVLSGAITVNSKTQTSINVSCSAATDNVGVAYYEWSSNGGTSWVTGATTHNFTGLTADTQYQIRARASDAAGNKSSALSLAVTTDAEAAPVLTGAITVNSKTSSSINVSCPSASGSVTGYEWSIGGGWVSDTTSHSFTGLVASTEYTVQVRAVGPGGNSATLSLPVTTDAVAAAASLTLGPLVNNTGTLHASVNGITVHVINGAAVVTKTGVSTNSAGVLTVSDAAFTAGTTYRAIIVFADGSEGLGKVVAT